MRLDWWTVAMPIGLTLLGLLLTGPGMWSDRWGWGWVRKGGDGKADAAGAGPSPADPATAARHRRTPGR
jgi:hypothetical protein